MKKQTEQNKKVLLHEDHPRPVTRRDFLAQGFVDLATVLMAPRLLTLITREAIAATCPPTAPAAGLLPLIAIDCAGGASLSGNFVVGKAGGAMDYLTSYNTLGIPTAPQNNPGSVDTRFGAPMHLASKIRQGMLNVMSAECQGKTTLMTICHSGQDDSRMNALSPIVLATQGGLRGSQFLAGLGMSESGSGGNSASPVNDPALKPLLVSSVTSVTSALSYGTAISGLPAQQKVALAKAISNMTASQVANVQSMTLGDQFSNLVECGLIKNQGTASAAPAVDPRVDPIFQSVYGITTTSTNRQAQIAAITYNVLKRNCGPGAIIIGGCDYHDATQTTGDTKDLEIGTELGRVLEAAHRMGQGVVVVGYTDGGIISDAGTRVWRTDSGVRSLSWVAFYNPAGKPALTRSQVGNYTDGQGADRETFFGGNPTLVSYIMLLNYLKASGRMDLQPILAPANVFPQAEIPKVLGFA
jgi:hypothetical protein